MSDGLVIFARAAIAFVTLLIFTRILGKQQVSQLSFFDYIIGITVGSVAADMIDTTKSIALHIVGLGSWMGLAFVLQVITLKSQTMSKIVDGTPVIVVQNGKILEQNMAKLRYRDRDLLEQLRLKDVFNLSEVEYAILESNGNLSVLLKTQHQPVTPNDLNIPTQFEGISLGLIFEGKVHWDNLRKVKLDKKWLDNELKKNGIDSVKDVFQATLDSAGNLYIDKYKDLDKG